MKSSSFRQIILFSPGVLILTPVMLQYFIWLNLDGNNILNLSREDSAVANYLFFWYVFLVLIGVIFANKVIRISIRKMYFKEKTILKYSLWWFLIFILASFLFSRHHLDVIRDILSLNLRMGVNYADLTSDARSNTLPGITSFTYVSIFVTSAYVYCRMVFGSKIYPFLISLIAISALLAFTFGMRITLLFNVFAATWIFFLFSSYGQKKISISKTLLFFSLGLIMFFFTFSFFEYVRKWQNVSPEFSDSGFLGFSFNYLTVPYLAKNHYNAVIYFESEPTHNLIGSSPFFLRIASALGYDPEFFSDNLIRDFGEHGTVLVFALWYHDMGLAVSSFIVFFISFISQSVFLSAINNKDFHSSILYSILVPGLLSICRANYFGSVAFVVNLIPLYTLMLVIRKRHSAY